jgi:ketosteroid isomerase-like protein
MSLIISSDHLSPKTSREQPIGQSDLVFSITFILKVLAVCNSFIYLYLQNATTKLTHYQFLKIKKMETSKSTKQLLETYYKGFAQKEGWESVLSDDFKFIGGDMTKTDPVVGKAAYIEVIKRFSRSFQTMRVKEMIIEGEHASVIGNYDFKFPNGVSINGDVAEIWKAKNGKLDSLTIFFDSLTFDKNLPK